MMMLFVSAPSFPPESSKGDCKPERCYIIFRASAREGKTGASCCCWAARREKRNKSCVGKSMIHLAPFPLPRLGLRLPDKDGRFGKTVRHTKGRLRFSVPWRVSSRAGRIFMLLSRAKTCAHDDWPLTLPVAQRFPVVY